MARMACKALKSKQALLERGLTKIFRLDSLTSLVRKVRAGLQGKQSIPRSQFIYPDGDIMRLECEGKAPVENPKPSLVRKVIFSLRSYGPSSYASITDPQGSYLQVAGGGETCLLELYQSNTGKRLRAFSDKKNKAFPDGTLLVFRAGEIAMQSDEWFIADKIAEAFCNFLEGKELPKDIHWRPAPGF